MASETEDPKPSSGGAASNHAAQPEAVNPAFSQMPFEPGVVIHGKYELVRPLGSGGLGVVVAARHIGFDDLVALKFLRPEFASHQEAVSRFTIEARASFKLRSEHIARMLDVDLYEGVPFIAMELLEGTDLRNLLEARRTLEVQPAVDYLLQTCEALASAHAIGVIHRDIKPENLFLLGDGDATDHLKVLDFGISKVAVRGESRRTHQALTRIAVGTPPYMSPEQVRASTALDARSDIWSVGCVLYELLTGTAPFERVSLMQACAAVLEDQPAAPSELRADLPTPLSDVIVRCLHKDPAARFADVASLAEALSPFGSGRFAGYPRRCHAHLAGEGLGRRSTPNGFARVHPSHSRDSQAGQPGETLQTGTDGGGTELAAAGANPVDRAAARMISVRLESHAPLTRRASIGPTAGPTAGPTGQKPAVAPQAAVAIAAARPEAPPNAAAPAPAVEPAPPPAPARVADAAHVADADRSDDVELSDPAMYGRAPKSRALQLAAWGVPIVVGGLLATYLATAEQRARSTGPSLYPLHVSDGPTEGAPALVRPEPRHEAEHLGDDALELELDQELGDQAQGPQPKDGVSPAENTDDKAGQTAASAQELARAAAGDGRSEDAPSTGQRAASASSPSSKHTSSSHSGGTTHTTRSKPRSARPSSVPAQEPEQAAALRQLSDPDVGF